MTIHFYILSAAMVQAVEIHPQELPEPDFLYGQ